MENIKNKNISENLRKTYILFPGIVRNDKIINFFEQNQETLLKKEFFITSVYSLGMSDNPKFIQILMNAFDRINDIEKDMIISKSCFFRPHSDTLRIALQSSLNYLTKKLCNR